MRFEKFEPSINQFKEKEPKPVDDFEKKIKEIKESIKEISPEEKERISKRGIFSALFRRFPELFGI